MTETATAPAQELPLLRLSAQERRGLRWAKDFARFWLTALKRRRKHLPRGAPYGELEATILRALLALEASSAELLGASAEKEP